MEWFHSNSNIPFDVKLDFPGNPFSHFGFWIADFGLLILALMVIKILS